MNPIHFQKKTIIPLLLFTLHFLDIKAQEAEPESPIESFTKAIVSIGVVSKLEKNGRETDSLKKTYLNVIGTGVIFYVKLKQPNGYLSIPCIITAKHVIYAPDKKFKPKSVSIRFKSDEKKALDNYTGIKLELYNSKGERNWYPHNDTTVDLACIPLTEYGNEIANIPMKCMSYSMILDISKCYDSQEIFALGFPAMGNIKYSTKPIVRRGIISWISPINTDITPYLVDCNLFPGNSGGPIFVNESGFRKNGSFALGLDYKFIGIATTMTNRNTPVFSDSSKTIADSKGKNIYSSQSFSIGTIEPAMRVRELLAEVEVEMNKLYH